MKRDELQIDKVYYLVDKDQIEFQGVGRFVEFQFSTEIGLFEILSYIDSFKKKDYGTVIGFDDFTSNGNFQFFPREVYKLNDWTRWYYQKDINNEI